MPLPVVAIVGRPNVGKSTLFNRIVGFRKAVVHDTPGVTRDRLYEETDFFGRNILAIDTGGLEPDPDSDLLGAMRLQSLIAIEEADVILFVVDGRKGIVPADKEVADILRRSGSPVIVVVNKIDGQKQEDLAGDFWEMGLTPMATVSAAHGRGFYDLGELILERLPPEAEGTDDGMGEDEEENGGEEIDQRAFTGPIRIAVVGRPNIGKSTFVNRLLGEDRHVVHDRPGTTMDPVDSLVEFGGKEYLLVDTAGVRRKARIGDHLERYVSLRAIRAIERCHVTALLIDGTEGPTDQDARLAQLVIDRGRALLILVNKWDLTKGNPDITAEATAEAIGLRLPHASWAPILFMAAKTGRGLHRVIPTINSIMVEFNHRISTPKLNRFLERAKIAHTPPQRYHRPVRLYYVTQTRVRPPTFTFFSNSPEGLKAPYRRYLANQLREVFGFKGTPLRLHFRRRRGLDSGDGSKS